MSVRRPLAARARTRRRRRRGGAAPGARRGARPQRGRRDRLRQRARDGDPGEIYALAPGQAPRPVFHSPYAEVALATAPKGRALAFWSDRSGAWRLMISPDGGSAAQRRGRAARAISRSRPGRPCSRADGTRLLVSRTWRATRSHRCPRSRSPRWPPARRSASTRLCGLPPVWAPDGRASPARIPTRPRVQVADVGGHVLFTAAGKLALWSAGGRLAVSGSARPRC